MYRSIRGVLAAAAGLCLAGTAAASAAPTRHLAPGRAATTPIQHLVVIFQENVSFDHYFGTYPYAANTDGQPFHPAPGTPAVDGLPPATSRSLPPAMGRAPLASASSWSST